LRPLFDDLNAKLLVVSSEARGELTTIYVKYSASETQGRYAVVWLRKVSEIIVGLALPTIITDPILTGPPSRHAYSGLTAYLCLKAGDRVPRQLADWAKIAFENRVSQ
jgi:hypothetical protein